MSLTTDKRNNLDAIIQEQGYTDYKWVDPQKFVVSQWVRMKCKFGCGEYGRGGACPPQTPSVDRVQSILQRIQRCSDPAL